MDLELQIPESVQQHLDALHTRGAQVLLVGGAVRDALLGQVSRDFDIATDLQPDQLQTLFDNVDPVLGSVQIALQDAQCNVTTFREEFDYADQRHPSRVEFVDSVAVDARRRDFTINAIYWDPYRSELIDPVGGVADLRAGTLEMIGKAEDRLREDPLRLLRAVRFAARFGLQLSQALESAVRAVGVEVSTLSKERIFDELTASFTGPGRGRALELLVELGLAEYILPEVTSMPGVEQPPEYHPEGDVFVHVCLVLDQVLPDDPVQAWAAVLHDTGKPATFERAADRIRFHGHDVLSAEIADRVLRRFRAPRELRETVVEVCRDHIRFAALPQMRRAKRERWLRSPRFPAHLQFHRADCLGSHAKLDIFEAAQAALSSLPDLPPPSLCTGRDVAALGVAEGPAVGELLRAVEDWCDDNEVSERDVALAQLRRLVDERFRGGS
ncbi:MAG: CCA tRNA nucleotidyltransferase [Planctomycetota bacterium]|nr:CCA tRNA nucleotidyltransferase [Planctomycetota bacterium]